MTGMSPPPPRHTTEPEPEPWGVDRLSAVLASAAQEHFADRYEMTLCSSNGTAETYEVVEPDDPDDDSAPLRIARTADGALFEVEFWADVQRLDKPPVPAAAGRGAADGTPR
jgi:hypothetical protein